MNLTLVVFLVFVLHIYYSNSLPESSVEIACYIDYYYKMIAYSLQHFPISSLGGWMGHVLTAGH